MYAVRREFTIEDIEHELQQKLDAFAETYGKRQEGPGFLFAPLTELGKTKWPTT